MYLPSSKTQSCARGIKAVDYLHWEVGGNPTPSDQF